MLGLRAWGVDNPGVESLPVDAALGAIRAALGAYRAVVVTAAPGAGKTTRVPPALVDNGPVILLQPRRVAARAIARRIAEERGWSIGAEIGWHIRFERRFGASTRLLVATEGILTARLQADPLLSGFRTVVLDEFHERSLHADLGLALARQAWRTRDDLRIVVMSATIDASEVSAYLGGCPHVDVPGRLHPLEIEYAPGEHVADRTWLEAGRASGCVLAFLPGAGEIRRAQDLLASRAAAAGIDVLPLHGSLEGAAQDAALRPSRRPRIVLATNIAETTLTVPDVVAVVDSGLQKTARYDAERGIDSLETERVTADAADQRAGRGRVWVLDARFACGTRGIGCAGTASPTSRAWTSPARCSTCSSGVRIPGPSSGSRRPIPPASVPPSICSRHSALPRTVA